MEINIFGKKITIGASSTKSEKNYINYAQNNNLTYVGKDITACGEIRIDNKTMYRIQKLNKMAFAYKNKIAQMVGRYGLEVVDSDDVLINEREQKNVLSLVHNLIGGKDKLDIFIQDFFTETFCSGQIFAVPSVINGLGLIGDNGRIKILDSRGMHMKVDNYGDVQAYNYVTKFGTESYIDDEILDFIIYRDVDYKRKGLSIYNSVAMEAITNEFANKTQMYFFKNNGKPNVYIMLHPEAFNTGDGPEKKKKFDQERENKYGGTENVGKTHTSHLIKDIKTLDISNVDLDLVNLRKENDASFGAVFCLDPRLIGLTKDTGSYGEVESMTIRQGNEQIDAYGKMFSNFMTSFYKKFVDNNFEYEFRSVNSVFKNINQDKKVALDEVKNGTKSRNEYRVLFDEAKAKGKNMDSYTIPNGYKDLNNLQEK